VSVIVRFEDIEAWRKSRELVKDIYGITSGGGFAKDFGLRDQIRRAAISVMSNIAEGFERGGNKEFLQFLALAKGSSGEVRSQLYVALDQSYLGQKDFDSVSAQATEVSRLIAGLMKYLKETDLRGSKYR
jgi:four helix bundle protein